MKGLSRPTHILLIGLCLNGLMLDMCCGVFTIDLSLFNLPRFNLDNLFGGGFTNNYEINLNSNRQSPQGPTARRRSPSSIFYSASDTNIPSGYPDSGVPSNVENRDKAGLSKKLGSSAHVNSIETDMKSLDNELSLNMKKNNKFYDNPHSTVTPPPYWNPHHQNHTRPSNASLFFPDLSILRQLFQWSGQSARSFALCHACKVGIGLFMLRARSGAKAEHLMRLVVFGCTFFRIAPEEMCQGLVTRFGPPLLYIVTERNELSADIFCGMILQSIGCSTRDPEIHWDVVNYQYREAEEKERALKKRSSELQIPANAPTLKILHITDIHVDPEYRPGANALCDTEMCCRNFEPSKSNGQSPAGYYGDYRKCDLPYHSYENALAHIAQTHKDINLIYMTGDLVPHNVWSTEPEENVQIIQNCSDTLYRYFPNATIFPVIGNHETHPVNLFSPPGVPQKFATDWVYTSAARAWGRWLPQESLKTFLHAGFYDRVVNPRFRVIVLNTNLCYTYNFWQMYEDKDPAGQLKWLEAELKKSEVLDQKVHILGHVPPGQEDCWNVWSKNFYQIITKYSGTVTAQFYGHTHFDEFKLFYHPIEKGRPINTLWIGASLTPYTDLNPGYKIFHVDGTRGPESSYHVLDHETWIYNLSEANIQAPMPPRWHRLYRATEAYNIPNVLPDTLNRLVHRMSSNSTDFNTYLRLYYKATDSQVGDCDAVCRKRLLCNIVTPYQKQQTECMLLQSELDGVILPMRIFETKRPHGEQQSPSDSREFTFNLKDFTDSSRTTERTPSIFDRLFGSRSYLFGR